MSSTENTIPIEAWNTVLFDKFCRFRNVLTHGLSDHSEEFFKRNTYPKGGRVLDVGCGFGDTTQQIAKQVGPSGVAVGVDCAQNFIDIAKREAREAQLANTLSCALTCRPIICPAPMIMFSPVSALCSSTCRVPPCATSAAP